MSSYDETCIVLDSSGVPKPCSPANHGSLGFVFSEGVCRADNVQSRRGQSLSGASSRRKHVLPRPGISAVSGINGETPKKQLRSSAILER